MHITAKQFYLPLLKWFDSHGRKNLPWQQEITPYRVWLSEVMLQQTQVKTVIPYFERFITNFPTVHDLAKASSDEVLALWSGLGYYSRARNLHQTAKFISQDFDGSFPEKPEELELLPGIGRSTACAITSIAFKQATAILDGNVKRILTRVFMIDGWPEKSDVKRKLWQIAEYIMPNTRCNDYTQAIMDLGAAVCTRSKPLCQQCPIAKHCLSYKSNTIKNYPHKKPRKKIPLRKTNFIILSNDKQQILLEKRTDVGLWGGLWCLPTIDNDSQLSIELNNRYNTANAQLQLLQEFRHTFSHFHLDIKIWHTPIDKKILQVNQCDQAWYDKSSLNTIGLAKPISKALNHFYSLPLISPILDNQY